MVLDMPYCVFVNKSEEPLKLWWFSSSDNEMLYHLIETFFSSFLHLFHIIEVSMDMTISYVVIFL